MTLKKVKLLLKNRIVLFFGFFVALLLLNLFSTGRVFPTTETKDLWFYSGVFMVLFTVLFIEPYYSSPKNVITNTVPLILVFLAIKSDIANQTQWWVIVISLILLLIIAVVAMVLDDKNSSPTSFKNRLSERLKNIAIFFGKGKRLYSAIFLYFLLVYYVGQDNLSWYVFWLLVIWAFMLLIDQNDLTNAFLGSKKEKDKSAVGQIFGIESQKMFLVKLFDDSKNLKKFDVVKFNHSMRSSNVTYAGVVFDYYLLNQERWAKVLQLGNCDNYSKNFIDNTVYVAKGDEKRELTSNLQINRFAGVVIEGSQIGRIKFQYSKLEDNLQEGDLLELLVGARRLFYQVVTGSTEKEQLEARNEAGFIEGEAIQLGEWIVSDLSFRKFGWVPQINTPLFLADTSNITVPEFEYPEYKVGNIPGTSLPSLINLDDAISHHMAILGVTGSGKSHLARDIITTLKQDTKVICIDFNKEFSKEMQPSPANIVSAEKAEAIAANIDWINDELDKFANQQNKVEIARRKELIRDDLKTEISSFIDSDDFSPVVFELPDVVNTTGILDYTKNFFRVLFEVAKERQQADNPVKVCVVLEEAHTIVPEWNFASSSDKTSQSLVNSISQIALQGRKYGIGFLVIAQRTANVSKTVLTQCNTVICFQAFDETSFNFLSSYVGKDMIGALPNLKQYHAVITGKAVKSNIPMIIDLTKESAS